MDMNRPTEEDLVDVQEHEDAVARNRSRLDTFSAIVGARNKDLARILPNSGVPECFGRLVDVNMVNRTIQLFPPGGAALAFETGDIGAVDEEELYSKVVTHGARIFLNQSQRQADEALAHTMERVEEKYQEARSQLQQLAKCCMCAQFAKCAVLSGYGFQKGLE